MSAPVFPPACVIGVAAGRGFVIEPSNPRPWRLVVTAAHCLPLRDRPVGVLDSEDATYRELIGPAAGSRSVWAELLFADPVSDIAVLGPPDGQELWGQHDAYVDFVGKTPALRVGHIPAILGGVEGAPFQGWVLTLDRVWEELTMRPIGLGVFVVHGGQHFRPGVSGSLILDDAGNAVALCSTAAMTVGHDIFEERSDGAMEPGLRQSFPGWLLKTLKRPVRMMHGRD